MIRYFGIFLLSTISIVNVFRASESFAEAQGLEPIVVPGLDAGEGVQSEVITSDRQNFRGALDASEKAKTSASPGVFPSLEPSTQVEPAPPVDPALTPDSKHYSRTELLRRERLRSEVKNEDLLQERLERLRLRDENKRTSTILNEDASDSIESAQSAAVMPPAPSQGNLDPNGWQEEARASTPLPSRDANFTSVSSDGTLSEDFSTDKPEKTFFSITPRGGVTGFLSTPGYETSPRFTAGVGALVETSENLSVDLGYSFSEVGVRMSNNNPWVYQVQTFYPQSRFETVVMKQNVFDLGMRLSLLNREATVRPFIGAGLGYSQSYVNYDPTIIRNLRAYGFGFATEDYEISQWLGRLTAGLSVRASRLVSFSLTGNYYTVLSSRESSSLNSPVLYGPGYYAYSPAYGGYNGGYPSDQKQSAGGTLARSGFYSILAGLSFSL